MQMAKAPAAAQDEPLITALGGVVLIGGLVAVAVGVVYKMRERARGDVDATWAEAGRRGDGYGATARRGGAAARAGGGGGLGSPTAAAAQSRRRAGYASISEAEEML
jgi:hypothetical protein